MNISCLHSRLDQELSQVLCHSLSQGGHQGTLVFLDPEPDLIHQVIYLVLAGTKLDLRIQ